MSGNIILKNGASLKNNGPLFMSVSSSRWSIGCNALPQRKAILIVAPFCSTAQFHPQYNWIVSPLSFLHRRGGVGISSFSPTVVQPPSPSFRSHNRTTHTTELPLATTTKHVALIVATPQTTENHGDTLRCNHGCTLRCILSTPHPVVFFPMCPQPARGYLGAQDLEPIFGLESVVHVGPLQHVFWGVLAIRVEAERDPSAGRVSNDEPSDGLGRGVFREKRMHEGESGQSWGWRGGAWNGGRCCGQCRTSYAC